MKKGCCRNSPFFQNLKKLTHYIILIYLNTNKSTTYYNYKPKNQFLLSILMQRYELFRINAIFCV